MKWLSKLFDVEETIEDSVKYEEEDEKADIEWSNEALFNRTDEDDNIPIGFYAPPKQKVWWRL